MARETDHQTGELFHEVPLGPAFGAQEDQHPNQREREGGHCWAHWGWKVLHHSGSVQTLRTRTRVGLQDRGQVRCSANGTALAETKHRSDSADSFPVQWDHPQEPGSLLIVLGGETVGSAQGIESEIDS